MRYLCVASSESLRTAEQGEASWNESTDRALAGTKLRSCHSCVMPRQAPSSLPEPQHATLPARRWNLVFLYPLPISQCLPPSPISASPAPPPALHHCLLPASAPETSVCYLTRPGHGWIKGCLFPQDRSPVPAAAQGCHVVSAGQQATVMVKESREWLPGHLQCGGWGTLLWQLRSVVITSSGWGHQHGDSRCQGWTWFGGPRTGRENPWDQQVW